MRGHHWLYVDDVAGKTAGRNFTEYMNNKAITDEIAQNEMHTVGVDMNRGKEETIISGPRADVVQLIKRQTPTAAPAARYLGARHADNGGFTEEKQYRIAAVRKAWACLWRFFCDKAMHEFKMGIFLWHGACTRKCHQGVFSIVEEFRRVRYPPRGERPAYCS